jgi:hypothetical protein
MQVNDKFLRRQIAARRLFLSGDGKLNPDARKLAAYMARLCHAKGRIVVHGADGKIDPVATTAAAARREVWDDLVRLLNLDPYEIANLKDDQ